MTSYSLEFDYEKYRGLADQINEYLPCVTSRLVQITWLTFPILLMIFSVYPISLVED